MLYEHCSYNLDCLDCYYIRYLNSSSNETIYMSSSKYQRCAAPDLPVTNTNHHVVVTSAVQILTETHVTKFH